jgi:hypothetical protein
MLKKILIVVAALAAIAVFLVSRDWDSPELGRAVLEKVSAATGIQVQAQGFRLNVLKGVVLDKVQAKSSSEGRDLTFQLDRLIFEHRLLPLLSGTVAVDRILLQKPRFEIVQTGSGSASAKEPEPPESPAGDTEAEAGGGLAFDMKRIQIEDGSLSVKNTEGVEKTSVEGLDFEIRDVAFDPAAQSLKSLSGEGTLGIQTMTFDTLKLTETEGEFHLADAVFTIPALSFRMPQGKFTADAKLDFNAVPFAYTMNARGDPLDLNGMVGATEGFGPAALELQANGSGPETKDLKGSGQVRVAEGSFPDAKLFRDVDAALGKKAVVGSKYQATQMSFTMEDDRIALAPFRFETGDARLDLQGSLLLTGLVDFDVSLATPREGLRIEGAGAGVLDVMADDQGWVPVPIDITGTLEDPKVRPDVKAMASQAGHGVKREVTEKATDALKGLLKKKKE